FQIFLFIIVSYNVYVNSCQTGDNDPEDLLELDEDQLFYFDFKRNEMVYTMADFSKKIIFPTWSQQALLELQICLHNLNLSIFNDFLTISDPPQVTIYPRDYVLPGEGNKLICLVNNFFPPPVKVKWTKNDVEVTEGVTLSRYYPNKDLTFRQYSTVPIIPQEGDVYSCTVEHKGLSEPETRLWGKITIILTSSPFPTICCVVHLFQSKFN
uniref:Ig-like domain-containing protein n=1 Tax=Scleropages formosus TaxID=113540 RepID=A0A8C9TL69_SCLFO